MANGRNPGQRERTPKVSTKHPYAAIEHRVIDSPAFADMNFSAHALLLLIARQLTRDNNNGHLNAAFGYCRKFGFGSEHTLRAALSELISHGFIYKTRSHGANGAWATYAVTWKSITKRDGLFLDGFVPCAWRDWQPGEKKSWRQKVPHDSGRKCSFTPENPAETAGSAPAKTADYELIPDTALESPAEQSSGLSRLNGFGPDLDRSTKGQKPARRSRNETSAPHRPYAGLTHLLLDGTLTAGTLTAAEVETLGRLPRLEQRRVLRYRGSARRLDDVFPLTGKKRRRAGEEASG